MPRSRLFGSGSSAQQEDHWIPLSDLMTGLMMVFLLIAILFMVKIEEQSKQIRNIALVYEAMKSSLYLDLLDEFKDDLPRWKAELDPDLTIRFVEPSVLFDSGKAEIKPEFARILDEFIPRYIGILSSSRYSESIEELRIEGHTSSFWADLPRDAAYFRNMELSQSRTRSVLAYIFDMESMRSKRDWLISRVTANGLSSSRVRRNPDGSENWRASQRVEFRVRTNAESKISEIIRAATR